MIEFDNREYECVQIRLSVFGCVICVVIFTIVIVLIECKHIQIRNELNIPPLGHTRYGHAV